VGPQVFGMRRNLDGTYELLYRLPDATPSLGSGGRNHSRITAPPDLAKIPFGSPVKCYGFPPDAGLYLTDIADALPRERWAKVDEREVGHPTYRGLPALQLAFENLFAKVHYLGPIRSFPERVYQWGGEKPLDTGWDGDQAIAALLASSMEDRVAGWLKKMELIDSFRLEPVDPARTIFQCWVRVVPTSLEVLLPDVGFGVSQILPVLVDCAMLRDNSVLLLEQPEIHLHPFAQAALADVLIDAIKSQNIQIIVESHSEHLLRRIQRRIAEEAFPAEDTALYFCRFKDGASKAEELKLDDYGYITNWPEHFFGDEMGEIANMTVAATQRRKAGRK